MKVRSINNNIIGLIGCTCINNILYMFLNTFMIAYFITLTNYDYKLISIYYILSFVFILLTFILLGKVIKNKTQTNIFRFGIVMYCIYILLVALLKEKIVNYYLLLGSFYGVIQGFFWSAGHSLINEYTLKNENDFISIKSIIGKILEVILPFVLGVSIEFTSFSIVAKIIVILSILQFSFSLLIDDKNVVYEKKYSLKEYLKYIKNNIKFKTFYKLIACDGIVSYLLDTIITILIVMSFKTALNLGILTTIFSLLSILSIYIFQKKLKNTRKISIISTVFIIISTILLIIDINNFTVIFYNLCDSVFLVLLINKAETKRYEMVSKDKIVNKDYLVEHQVLTEVFLNISRIIGYFILFIASIFSNMLIFKILLAIITIIIIIYCILMNKLD